MRRQEDTREVLIQKFKNGTNENTAEAIAYLEGSNWNLEAAIASWTEDSKWEAKNGNQLNLVSTVLETDDNVDDFVDQSEKNQSMETIGMEYHSIPPAAVQYDLPSYLRSSLKSRPADSILAQPNVIESSCVPLLG